MESDGVRISETMGYISETTESFSEEETLLRQGNPIPKHPSRT